MDEQSRDPSRREPRTWARPAHLCAPTGVGGILGVPAFILPFSDSSGILVGSLATVLKSNLPSLPLQPGAAV